ncbi:MAG: hypothetical protein ORO03_06505, partial [Alphaproteobacteria bacterium]|nr:hypothetical protein [Alphaproteobacteria bacterium]
IETSSPLVLARPVTISSLGVIHLPMVSSLPSSSLSVFLRIDAGFSGIIRLGGTVGSQSTPFVWVELNGVVDNRSGHGFYSLGGLASPSGQHQNQRYGRSL